jgi:hypothetical protein
MPFGPPINEESIAMATLVRAAVLTNYLEVAQHLGINAQAELSRVGLSKRLLQDPDQPIPVSSAVQLLEHSAASSGCQTFGLRMAESRQFSDLGAVALLLTHQATLRDALQAVVQYRHLLNRALAIYIEEAGDLVVIREEVVTDTPMPCRQATELALGVMARLCASLLGAAWRPASVNFTHDAPGDQRVHRRVFGCDVRFGAEFNGIACPGAAFDAPNPKADPAMARYAQRFIDTLPGAHESSLVFEVRKAIYLLLPMGRATIEQIAQALGGECTHAATPPGGRRRQLQRFDQRGATRPGAALYEQSQLLAGAHRRPAGLFAAQQLQPLVRRTVRRYAGQLARPAQQADAAAAVAATPFPRR